MAELIHKLSAEFLGTFLLVFTVACNVLTGQTVWGAASIASVLAVAVWAMGPLSGGHFNPAVTLAVFLDGTINGKESISLCDALCYVVSQLAGAQCARLVAWVMLGKFLVVGGAVSVAACSVELIYTFMLTYVVLNVACRREATQHFGLAIGFVIIAGGYAVGGISGGAFNPAVASCARLLTIPAYWAVELLGGALAAGLTKVVYNNGDAATLTSKLLSEFLGTFMLATTMGFNVLGGSPAGALSIGMSLACMIFADGGVSGGHCNPAVTTACIFRKAIDVKEGAAYIGTQLIAGAAAGAVYSSILGKHGEVAPMGGHSLLQAAFAEFMFTFVLTFVVLCVATVRNQASPQFNGLAVGLCIVVGGNAVGAVSGGHLNPAVSFGFAVSGWINSLASAGLWAFLLAQFLAGVAAAAKFWFIFSDERKTDAREYFSIE